jgi:hypothetical protein
MSHHARVKSNMEDYMGGRQRRSEWEGDRGRVRKCEREKDREGEGGEYSALAADAERQQRK